MQEGRDLGSVSRGSNQTNRNLLRFYYKRNLMHDLGLYRGAENGEAKLKWRANSETGRTGRCSLPFLRAERGGGVTRSRGHPLRAGTTGSLVAGTGLTEATWLLLEMLP